MKLDSRLTIIIALIVAAGVVAGGWFLAISPQLAAAAASDSQRQQVDAQNAQLEQQLAGLAKSKSTMDATTAQVATLRESVPPTDTSSALLRSIQQLASASGVEVKAFTPGTPTAYLAPGAAPAAASSAASGASASPSASPSAPATAAPTPANTAVYTDPLITGSNFTVVPFSVQVSGSDAQVRAFLAAMQSGSRLILVKGMDRSIDSSGEGTSLSVQANAYVLSAGAASSATTKDSSSSNG